MNKTASKNTDLLEGALNAIEKLRVEGARVHCITNTVAQQFTANILLAIGATPSMTVSPEEVSYFSERSDAVLINLGTLDDQRQRAIENSLAACKAASKPFVLDPVMCHVSPPRLAFAKAMLKHQPAIIRMNAQEAEVLGSKNISEETIIALTGQLDQLLFQDQTFSIANGHIWLSKVTAVGCAQGAIMAALLSKTENPLAAALGALIWIGVSGEKAAEKSNGPGSFQTALIDQLHSIAIPELRKKARMS